MLLLFHPVHDRPAPSTSLPIILSHLPRSDLRDRPVAPLDKSPRRKYAFRSLMVTTQLTSSWSTSILPNLLPSPAPSDEPSPSLSKSQDSPGLRSHALSQPQQNHLLSANAPAAQQPISPDSCEQAEAPTGTVSQNATIETDSIPTTQTVADQTQSGAHSPQVMPPPRLFEASQPEQAMTMASVALPVDPSNRVQPRSGPDGGPPTKKRRIE